MSARVHQHAALQHNAIFYDAPADLTTNAVDFVREGLEAWYAAILADRERRRK